MDITKRKLWSALSGAATAIVAAAYGPLKALASAPHATTIGEMMEETERRFTIHPLDGAYAPTGELYVMVCSSDLIPGPGPSSSGATTGWQRDPDLAVRCWIAAMYDYMEGKSGTLYWRELPELSYRKQWGWGVYSRLLISNKPIIHAEM